MPCECLNQKLSIKVPLNTSMPTCLSLFSPAAGGPSPQHCFKSPCYYGNPQPGSLGLAVGRCKPECRQNNESETERENKLKESLTVYTINLPSYS